MTDAPAKRDTLISKIQNREMFDTIAHRYDLMNKIISLGRDGVWRRRAISALAPCAGGRFLDVGSGTGDLAMDIAAAVEDARIVGLDPSSGMLILGQAKVSEKGLETAVSFVTGDAMALPFSDNQFDGVILGFCIRNVENRLAAIREFRRVLKPGARLVILELTVPANPLLSLGHLIYTGTVIPTVSWLLTKKGAYDYLVKSVRAFPPAETFLTQMLDQGFERGRIEPLLFGSVTIFVAEK